MTSMITTGLTVQRRKVPLFLFYLLSKLHSLLKVFFFLPPRLTSTAKKRKADKVRFSSLSFEAVPCQFNSKHWALCHLFPFHFRIQIHQEDPNPSSIRAVSWNQPFLRLYTGVKCQIMYNRPYVRCACECKEKVYTPLFKRQAFVMCTKKNHILF